MRCHRLCQYHTWNAKEIVLSVFAGAEIRDRPITYSRKSICPDPSWKIEQIFVSHNNPCFPCNIAITNFLILYTCKIRFYDIIERTVHTFTSWHHPTQKFQNMAKWVYFGHLFFNLICLIQLCDKKNLTFVDCWDKILLNSSWKTLLSSPKAHLITFSKTHLIFYLNC